jgi:serine phosphatase RsbU (regulator of sigma subunit)
MTNNSYARKEITSARLKYIFHEKVRIRERLAFNANKDLTSSIDYAKKIQEAVLPDQKKPDALFSGHFIFYQPKDIVSGDFFWFEQRADLSIIAIADCTGHGVPGGFMSMLGIMLLNLIVVERGIIQPDEILFQLHKELRKTLRQYEDTSELPDGMDISLCTLDRKKNILRFAGANHSLFFYNKESLTEIKGDQFGIGGQVLGMERVFSAHETVCRPGDQIYFSTDGYKDQFGGPRNKKFSKRKFTELLGGIAAYPAQQQKTILTESFCNWKGALAQTDDILVLGAKI